MRLKDIHLHMKEMDNPTLFRRGWRLHTSKLKLSFPYSCLWITTTVPFATADSPGPGQQIESNTPIARRPAIEWNNKKNNYITVPYNMRYWKCPPSSTHSWHIFKKCVFTSINSSSKIESISHLILQFSYCVGVRCIHFIFQVPHG